MKLLEITAPLSISLLLGITAAINRIGHWSAYVPNSTYLTQRGGTFLLDGQGQLLYQHAMPAPAPGHSGLCRADEPAPSFPSGTDQTD